MTCARQSKKPSAPQSGLALAAPSILVLPRFRLPVKPWPSPPPRFPSMVVPVGSRWPALLLLLLVLIMLMLLLVSDPFATVVKYCFAKLQFADDDATGADVHVLGCKHK